MKNSMPDLNIRYRSKPSSVNMDDVWYDLANIDHFWVTHRFNVLSSLFKSLKFINPSSKIADIGCGHGLLQKQLGDHFGWAVDGYDLNHFALRNSLATNHPLVFYDINERHEDLANYYDVVFLFDVIEHIDDERAFLDSVKFHLKPGGYLIVNVPTGPFLFSRYDKVVGHFRRYTSQALKSLFRQSGYSLVSSTNWGLPYIPLILLRKAMLTLQPELSDLEIMKTGFKPPSASLNSLFALISTFDIIPNHFIGSSLMSVYRT
jgi:2-polyprenyl-3-methyl-5-hydroxy-6-metoxy-1,4-benzoquinol methylase